MDRVGVGMIGSRFVAEIHAESFARIPNADIVAVASPTKDHVADFAARHGIPKHFTDYRELLELPEVDVVVLGLPNYLHCQACCDAAEAGKHVICEKPLCTTMAEADRMIQACASAGVKLMYAEELCFAPKYVRAKQLVDSGALGDLYLLKQCEKHDGPHAAWFWDVELSGGGVTLDMGCHGFEFFRWMLDKLEAVSVYADMGTFVHTDRTRGDDDAIIIVALGILPQFQNAGMGRSLISKIETKAKKLRKKRLLVSTSNDDLPALGFYQALGFQIYEIRPDVIAEKHGGFIMGIGGLPVRDELRLRKTLH